MERVRPFVEALMKAGKLDENQAKLLVYYCVVTWREEHDYAPIINLTGESGTGKTQIMRQMKTWCPDATWANATGMTEANFRDHLADKRVVFIDEADKTQKLKECERWLVRRYDPLNVETTYRTIKGKADFPVEKRNHFGYTVIHTQNPLESVELDRRMIRITLFKDSGRDYEITEDLDETILKEIAEEIDWESKIPNARSGSAWDTHLPIMRVASHLGDEEFLAYVFDLIEEKIREDDDTKEFEPKGVVLSEVAELYMSALEKGKRLIAITDITKKLRERIYQYSEKQVTGLARQLGFTIVKPRNKSHIKVESDDQLRRILTRAGYDLDEFFSVEEVERPVRWSAS